MPGADQTMDLIKSPMKTNTKPCSIRIKSFHSLVKVLHLTYLLPYFGSAAIRYQIMDQSINTYFI